MLRQQQQLDYNIKENKNFEDYQLYKKTPQPIPIEEAFGWSVFSHAGVAILLIVIPIILLLLGFQLDLFKKPQTKMKDIEFVLVNQPEQEPLNKNTKLYSDRNSRAGGINDPNRPVAAPQPALPKSAPSQTGNDKPQKVQEKAMPKPAPQKQVQTPQPKQEKTVQKSQPKPAPPKPMAARPSIPPTKAPTSMKLPIPPTKGAPRIAVTPQGPVTSKPSGTYNGSGSRTSPKPVIASGGYGSGSASRTPSNRGSGRGSTYSPGGGNVGNPSPGNPKGAPGVDANQKALFGAYMSALTQRIKSNWDPPRGEESKRVVLLFTIARDGRLLNVKVIKSSGTPSADKAALSAVELSAPFRPLPAGFKGSSVDIQFTFDYNVFGVNRY
ncbi:MAG: TonB family protein [Candidatus Gastranaerophilales bacterium]|nr:TonB family protein [Candidatus Gastranaerophilales bacterium]